MTQNKFIIDSQSSTGKPYKTKLENPKSKLPCQKILIADDDLAILESLSIFLKEEGCDVITISDGEKVMKMCDEAPSLLILDICMGSMDGREITKNLKEKSETKDIPIVLISASRNVHESAREAGADDFLEKPFEIDDLLKMINKHTKS